MGQRRYTVEYETVSKSLLEDVVESFGLETDEAIRATVTDEQTDRNASGVGSDREEAREVACDKLGISVDELDDEIEEDAE